MSGIDLKRFVDINIQKQITPIISGTRSTTVLFDTSVVTDQTYSSLSELSNAYNNTTKVYKYAKVYFDNGGANLYVKKQAASTLSENEVSALDDVYICIVSTSTAVDDMKSIASSRSASTYGINEKLLLSRTTSKTYSGSEKNFIVKYSNVEGAEMTIAAYLSRIDVYGIDTVYDYAFTQEVITEEDITDTEYSALEKHNINVDVKLAGAVRNCGGNCTDGVDIVNNFVRIILHQTLTDRLISLLTTKLKDSTGVSKIYTVITDELERYKLCGYLTTDKIWTKDTLKVKLDTGEYTIIEQGTPLTNGYFIKVLPFSSLSTEEKNAHEAPPVYVIIADQYGIRKITITGDVI